ncbi:MAG: hypothetical protein KF768_03705 [Phycisphaeraceae bacterium]|nr:hypothetical protein [Phycisphaeraceae bacterium]
MDPESLAAIAQLGAAGLIGYLWVTERRWAAERERQLREAHDALLDERRQVDVLVRVVEANTRALTAVEAAQRDLSAAFRSANPPPAAAPVSPARTHRADSTMPI